MKQLKQIHYRSIIDHGDNQKLSDRFVVDAWHECTFQNERYTFKHPTYGEMNVLVCGVQVELSYGQTKMEMVLNQRHHILYGTPYGQIELDVYLKKLERTANSLHIIYYLYDKTNILSKCYLMIDEINPMLS